MDNKGKIINFCRELGLTTVGFTKCREFKELEVYFCERKEKGLANEFEEEDIEKRINPFLLMEKGKTIISLAFPYKYDGYYSSKTGFSLYTYGLDYHRVVKGYLDKICKFIEELGGEAIGFVDSNPLPERYIAYLSGLGFIGKNNNLITKNYGSYVFLAEVITSLELEEDKPIESQCGECDLCIKVCPTSAIIKEENQGNCNQCLSYITQKKHIENQWFDKLKGRVFGCDTCQMVCPHNKQALNSTIEEFHPQEYMLKGELQDLIFLTNSDFKETFGKHSCGWRGKNILIRNALINYYNINREDKDNIEKSISSPYIKDYYEKLFKGNKC